MIEITSEVGVELISSSASDDMVAMSAWVSNDLDSVERLKDKSRVKGLISFLYRNEHMSPFEHGIFTFKVDVPLFVAREMQRHRAASYNEVSGRYTEMKPRFFASETARVQKGKMGDYYFVEANPDQTALYVQSKRKKLEEDWNCYQNRLQAGIAKEQAREDLPLSLMTQFYVSMNPRNLMHFLNLRTDPHALKEIRMVAEKMEEIFKEKMPFTYSAYEDAKAERNVEEDLRREIVSLKLDIDSLQRKYDFESKLAAERGVQIDILMDEINRLNNAKASVVNQPIITIKGDSSEFSSRLNEALDRQKKRKWWRRR